MDSVIEHERNGLLVTPDNELEICEAVTRLQSDEGLLARMRIEARRTYEELYFPSSNCRALLNIYESAIDVARQPLGTEA